MARIKLPLTFNQAYNEINDLLVTFITIKFSFAMGMRHFMEEELSDCLQESSEIDAIVSHENPEYLFSLTSHDIKALISDYGLRRKNKIDYQHACVDLSLRCHHFIRKQSLNSL